VSASQDTERWGIQGMQGHRFGDPETVQPCRTPTPHPGVLQQTGTRYLNELRVSKEIAIQKNRTKQSVKRPNRETEAIISSIVRNSAGLDNTIPKGRFNRVAGARVAESKQIRTSPWREVWVFLIGKS
jgi:hypothetical protein